MDGYDMWPYLVGDAAASPRTEIMLETGCKALGCAAPGCVGCNAKLPCGRFPCTGALISGDFKIILGMQSYGFWQGPIYPASSRRCVFPVAALISLTQTAAGQNATTNKTAIEVGVDCGSGCLFNIRDDPSEYSDLAQANPAKLAELRERFFALNSTAFHQLKLPQDEGLCSSYVQAHHGYVGPYLAGI